MQKKTTVDDRSASSRSQGGIDHARDPHRQPSAAAYARCYFTDKERMADRSVRIKHSRLRGLHAVVSRNKRRRNVVGDFAHLSPCLSRTSPCDHEAGRTAGANSPPTRPPEVVQSAPPENRLPRSGPSLLPGRRRHKRRWLGRLRSPNPRRDGSHFLALLAFSMFSLCSRRVKGRGAESADTVWECGIIRPRKE